MSCPRRRASGNPLTKLRDQHLGYWIGGSRPAVTASPPLGHWPLLRADGNPGHKARADAPVARGLGLAGPAFDAQLRAARFRRSLGRAIAFSLVLALLRIAGSHRRVGLQILESENLLQPLVLD